ncbi:hypothetical protein K501DRAFT_333860 [Backusella circina FSU 941]|nr:hypothetical protein K501DRAFT_333860 [Backusella circina FSU 941]
MPPKFGGAPQCPRCEKSVYMAEQVIGPGGFWHKFCLTCKECNKRLDSTLLAERDNEAYCKVCYNRKWGPKGYGFAGGAAFLSTETKMPSDILAEQEINCASPTLPSRTASPPLPQRPAFVGVTQGSQIRQDNTQSVYKETETTTKPSSSSTGGYLSHKTSYVPRKFNFNSQSDTCTSCGKAVYAAELALGAGNKYHKLCLKCCDCGKRLDSTNMVDKDFDLYCRGCYAKKFGPKGYGYGNLLTTEGSTR